MFAFGDRTQEAIFLNLKPGPMLMIISISYALTVVYNSVFELI
jgi:hypothetical protein